MRHMDACIVFQGQVDVAAYSCFLLANKIAHAFANKIAHALARLHTSTKLSQVMLAQWQTRAI